MPRSHFLPGYTGSDISLKRARQWIQTCECLHTSCGPGRDVALPKRLVDVNPLFDDAGSPGVKLAVTESQVGTYACLSHCWGDPKYIVSQLKTATISQYVHFLPWDTLPTTFQQSILLTRALGLRYLWIDCLCIIQDSDLDWQEESRKMGDIYRNGFLTIAAVSSADSRGGCFSQTEPDRCLRIWNQGSVDMLVGIRHCDPLGDKSEFSAVKTRYPLFTRAWVLQERKLSRRVLYCNREELQFGCQESVLCECSNTRMAPHIQNPPQQMNMDMANERVPPANPSYGGCDDGGGSIGWNLNLYHSWQGLVKTYTQLRLTFDRDKLPALSGCAKDLARAVGSDRYLAGLWRKMLMQDLLWYVKPRGPGAVQPRPSPWRAPSWSWASVNTPFGIEYVRPGPHIFLVDFDKAVVAAEVVPAGHDPTGEVVSGYIQLKAALGAAYVRSVYDNCFKGPGRNKRMVIHSLRGSAAADETDRCSFLEQGLESPSGGMGLHKDFSFTISYVLGRQNFIPSDENWNSCKLAPIFLLHIDHPGLSGERNLRAYFLVLKQIAAESNAFERIAFMTAVYADEQEREIWFEQTWGKCRAPEKTITLK